MSQDQLTVTEFVLISFQEGSNTSTDFKAIGV
jgi:hypothetical protein